MPMGAPLFGAAPPIIPEDHVRVHSQSMTMTLPAVDETRASFFGGYQPLDPPLSPAVAPLRGYAAAPLASAPPVAVPPAAGRHSPKLEAMAEAREREYEQRMQSIRERETKRGQEQQEDEDRRIERLLKHIEHEEQWVSGQLDRKLRLIDQQKYNRRAELCREWQQKVYGHIQKQIDQQLASIRTADISARRRDLMENFIRTSNSKLTGLYLDIIIEAEYDPLLAHKKLMKYSFTDLQDPLKLELNTANETPSGKPKPKPIYGRDSLAVEMWDKLDSTPYGRFDRMLGEGQPQLRPEGAQASRVNFDHYRVSTDPSDLEREFPRPKRVNFPGVVRNRQPSVVFDP